MAFRVVKPTPINPAEQQSAVVPNQALTQSTNVQELQQNLRLTNALSIIGDQRLVQQWQIILQHAGSCRETACQIAQQVATARQQGQPSQLQELLLQRSKEADAAFEQAISQISQFEKTIIQQAEGHQQQHQTLMIAGQQDARSHQPNAQVDGAQQNGQVIPFVQNGTIGVMNHRREQDLAIANSHVAFLLNLRTTDAARSEEHEQKVVNIVGAIYERVIDRLCDDQREMRHLVREISVLNGARNNVGQMDNLDRMLNITDPNWFNDQGKTGGPVLGTSFGIDQMLASLSSNNTQMMGEANKENGPMVAGDVDNQFQNVGAFTDQSPMTVGSSLNNTTNALGTDDAQLDINPLLAGINNTHGDFESITNNLMDTSAPVNTTTTSIGAQVDNSQNNASTSQMTSGDGAENGQVPFNGSMLDYADISAQAVAKVLAQSAATSSQSSNGANSSATQLNFEPFFKNGNFDFAAPFDFMEKIAGPPFESIQKDTGIVAGNVVETGVDAAAGVDNTQNSSRVSDVHLISRREMDDRADAVLDIPAARLPETEQNSGGGPLRRSTRPRRAVKPFGMVDETAKENQASTENTDIAAGSSNATRKRRGRGARAIVRGRGTSESTSTAASLSENVTHQQSTVNNGQDNKRKPGLFEYF